MSKYKNWTAKAEFILREYGQKLTDKQLVEKLKAEAGFITTEYAVRKHRQRLKILKPKGSALRGVKAPLGTPPCAGPQNKPAQE